MFVAKVGNHELKLDVGDVEAAGRLAAAHCNAKGGFPVFDDAGQRFAFDHHGRLLVAPEAVEAPVAKPESPGSEWRRLRRWLRPRRKR